MIKGIGRVGAVCGFAGLVGLGMLGSGGAFAFQGAWQGHATGAAKRVYFRPVAGAVRQAPATRWRPQQRSTFAARAVRPANRVAYPLGLPAPASASSFSVVPRKVSPARDELGRQFRPQGSERATQPATADARKASQRLQSQFRPASKTRKQPYEMTLASGRSNNIHRSYNAGYVAPGYAPVPQFAGYGRYWPMR